MVTYFRDWYLQKARGFPAASVGDCYKLSDLKHGLYPAILEDRVPQFWGSPAPSLPCPEVEPAQVPQLTAPTRAGLSQACHAILFWMASCLSPPL